jgi:hypothetical protein
LDPDWAVRPAAVEIGPGDITTDADDAQPSVAVGREFGRSVRSGQIVAGQVDRAAGGGQGPQVQVVISQARN